MSVEHNHTSLLKRCTIPPPLSLLHFEFVHAPSLLFFPKSILGQISHSLILICFVE